MITRNVHLLKPRRLSAWRKISLGTWRPNGDSQVYCEIKVNAEPALKKMAELNAGSDRKITMTHYMGKVMGKVLAEVPDLNAVVRLGNIYPRRDVDIFFHVVYEETELSGVVVRNIDQKNLTEISAELTKTASVIRSGEDQGFKKIKKSWDFIPAFLARPVLDLIGILSYGFNINIKGAGIPKDCFGSMMITNIGSLGFSSAFVPISPYTYTPLILALGKVAPTPVVLRDGSIGVETQVSLCFTFDHRVMDGARGAKMATLIKKYLSHPELL